MAIPKVFVSYSHDSQEHKKWMLDFATRLRNTGVDAIIDQWELKPGDDLPHFMETNLSKAEWVLMICTDRYVEKANAGMGGVGYEKMIITADLLKRIDSSKVIPIIRQSGSHNVPTFLKSKLFIDFSRPDMFEFSFDELIRTLHKSPLFIKPPIGNNPFTPVNNLPQERSTDAVKVLMKIVVDDFEGGEDWSTYKIVITRLGISRIMADLVIEEAKNLHLIKQDSYSNLYITAAGKQYALTHKII
jgi:hypothetical protein